VTDLTPAEHAVTVTSDAGSARRTVTVAAGGTASVMFSLSQARLRSRRRLALGLGAV